MVESTTSSSASDTPPPSKTTSSSASSDESTTAATITDTNNKTSNTTTTTLRKNQKQQQSVLLVNVICTAYATVSFFALWIPAYFCSVFTHKITNWFGWDIQKTITSVFMRWSSRLAVKMNPFWTVRTKRTDKAPKGNGRYIFVCNHQSNMDPILINSVFRFNAKWVSKDSIFNIPFGGYMMDHCGDIPISFSSSAVEDTATDKQSAKSCLSKCKEWLELDVPIFMFPEGRRSKDGELLEFKKGAFILAKQTNAKIVPCAIHGTKDVWPVGRDLPGPGKCMFVVGDVFDSKDFKDVDELTIYARERVLEIHQSAIDEHAKI